MRYATYRDEPRKLTVTAVRAPLDAVTKELLDRSGGLYTAKTTEVFYGSTVYFNRAPSDESVRFLFEIDGTTLAVELPESRYAAFKKLLLHE